MTLSINDQIDRVRAILATYSGIGTDISLGADLATPPGYEVYAKAGTREGVEKRSSTETRLLTVRVYAVLVGDFNDETKMRVGTRAANDFINPLADFIRQHHMLSLSTTAPVPFVSGMGQVSDFPSLPLSYKAKFYAGFELEFSVTTRR